MNEACLDLQKAGEFAIETRLYVKSLYFCRLNKDSKAGRCAYLPPREKEDKMLDFRDQILVRSNGSALLCLPLTFQLRLIRKISKISWT